MLVGILVTGCTSTQPYLSHTKLGDVEIILLDEARTNKFCRSLYKEVKKEPPSGYIAGCSLFPRNIIVCSEEDPEACGIELLKLIWWQQGEYEKFPEYDNIYR